MGAGELTPETPPAEGGSWLRDPVTGALTLLEQGCSTTAPANDTPPTEAGSPATDPSVDTGDVATTKSRKGA